MNSSPNQDTAPELSNSESNFRWRRARWLLGFAVMIGLGLVIPTWRASWGIVDFQGDEAIFGLMALHILQGEFPTFFYGQNYLGSAEAVVAAGFISLFGTDIFTLRLGAVLQFGVFLVLHAALVSRLWGYRVALISLLPLIVPAPYVLDYIYRPIGFVGPLLVCGTGALLLSQIAVPNRLRYVRSILLGIIIGFGLWSNQLVVVYVATLVIVYWLSTPEWSAIYSRLSLFCERIVQIPARELLLVLTIGAAVLVTLGLFSNACMPQASFAVAGRVARTLLEGGIAGLALLTFVISQRRWRLSLESGTLAAGVILGGLPQWQSWLVPNGDAQGAILPSCPTNALDHTRLVVGEVLPALWSMPSQSVLSSIHPQSMHPPGLLQSPLHEVVTGGLWIIVLLFVIALGLYVWSERTTLWSLLTLTPLTESRQAAAMLGLLFFIPLALAVLSGNMVNFAAGIRYSLITWQASSIMLAIFLARFVGRFKVLGLILMAFYVLQMGIVNLAFGAVWYFDKYTPYAPEEVAALEDYLAQNDLRRGYANYWDSYTLDFVTEERLIIAPYSGIDRVPRYSNLVNASPVQVFLFEPDYSPPDTGRMEDLLAFLRREKERNPSEGPVHPQKLERLASQVVLQQQQVASWKVWVVADR